MIEWLPCELHAHSLHSDGRNTVAELARKAAGMGLRAIALTDHNTVSGWGDIPEAERISGLTIIPALEWTTFFGHMVCLGTEGYIDWRFLGPGEAERGMAAVRESGGLAGIAHPYRLGEPWCCGCHWQFEVGDWRAADYMEVWSENDPWSKGSNRRAFGRWTELLNQGYRLSGVSGRDWHGDDSTAMMAVTWLGVEGDGRDWRDYRAALAAGRAFSSLGPSLSVSFEALGESYGIGARLPSGFGSGLLEVGLGLEERAAWRSWRAERYELRVVCKGGTAASAPVPAEGEFAAASFRLKEEALGAWFRVELWQGDEMRAFSNPLYVGDGERRGQ